VFVNFTDISTVETLKLLYIEETDIQQRACS